MTHDSDSINAITGLLSYLRRSWELNEFIWGLPLKEFPQSLRWFHAASIGTPHRRSGFPSWSWAGWEGDVMWSDALDIVNNSKMRKEGYRTLRTDLIVQLKGIQDRTLTLYGAVVKLDIRTEPFSEAYVSGTDLLMGIVRERNFRHNNTLPPGTYDLLVIERLTFQYDQTARTRQYVYMLLLDWDGDVATRRTKVRLFIEPDVDFSAAHPRMTEIQLR